MNTFKKIRDEYAKENGVLNWKEFDFVYSGRVPMLHWNRVVKRYADYVISQESKDKDNRLAFINCDREIEFKLFQSPRGARFGDKRPNEINVKINSSFDEKQLSKLIRYLNELRDAME